MINLIRTGFIMRSDNQRFSVKDLEHLVTPTKQRNEGLNLFSDTSQLITTEPGHSREILSPRFASLDLSAGKLLISEFPPTLFQQRQSSDFALASVKKESGRTGKKEPKGQEGKKG